MRPPHLKRLIPYIISFILLLAFGVYLWANYDKYYALFDFDAQVLLLLTGLTIFSTIINGFINYFLYRELGASAIGVTESIGLAAVNTLANQLPFAGGMIAKGLYLKKRHEVGYARFFSATVATFVLTIAVAGAIGLVTITTQSLRGNTTPSIWLILGFLVMSASMLSFWLPVTRIPAPAWLKRQLIQLESGWQLLKDNPRLLSHLIIMITGMILIFAARLWLVFQLLSQGVTFAQSTLFAAASVLTQLVTFTPGGLGIREGIVAAAALGHGIALDISIVAVGMDRILELAIVAIIATAYSYFLTRITLQSVN